MQELLAQPVAKTECGDLAGDRTQDGVFVYRGIPYASPPLRALRWRPPVPPARWSGVRQATEFAPDCVQVPSPVWRLDSGRSRAPGLSEDCLYLNVWTPSDQPDANLPVYVWFHGGGFVRGSAAEPAYDGASLARRGMIVVSVNYRLGAFGFLAHPSLAKESANGSSGNYGLLDTIAALRWIRDNISAFGGDPGRVTISGQSAGGAIVGSLLVSPLARGLFQRVIAQSPGSFRPLGSLEDAQSVGLHAGEDIEALRALPAEAVLALNGNYVPKARGLTTPRMLRPIVDGWVIPEQETALFLDGRFAQVPLIVGTCEDEGSMLVGNSQLPTVEAYRAFMELNFRDRAEEALELYPAATDADILPSYEAALGDTQFHYAARSMARASAAHQPDTYRFLFTRQTGGISRPAEHCDEMMYAFGTLDESAKTLGLESPSEEERALSETIQDAWIRFAATGNPNGGGMTNWPRYDAATDQTIEFGRSIEISHGFRSRHMDFLDRTYGFFQ